MFKQPTIAIVDDDPIYRKVISHLLKKNNFNILFEVINGSECVRVMQQAALLPDIIILDVEMPVMDGFETARTLKTIWPQVKIIGNSALTDRGFQKKMLEAGADYFIAKSFNSVEIIKFIKEVYKS